MEEVLRILLAVVTVFFLTVGVTTLVVSLLADRVNKGDDASSTTDEW